MDWSILSILILFGALAVTVMIMWWHVIINVKEIVHIRRLKARRGRKYTEGGLGSPPELVNHAACCRDYGGSGHKHPDCAHTVGGIILAVRRRYQQIARLKAGW
ncbi:hypothetical protein [Pantoea agglomerans]|uniref:hypothetical protein n=1 Tax=Enterobacter agglomerans TaxID=549 RepID=UPI0032094E90